MEQATLPVTAGANLQVNVGGQAPGFAFEQGGFNGGGYGGCNRIGGVWTVAGGGGGASDLRSGAYALSDRLLVAGGGGGGGGYGDALGNEGAAGGAGGGSGTDGTIGAAASGAAGGAPGLAGTQSSGGAGGAGGTGDISGPSGGGGSLGTGGSGDGDSSEGGDGGGGGGGHYGGGAGGGGGSNPIDNLGGGGGGGGGGSSFATATASNIQVTAGSQAGNVQVTITYTTLSDQIAALKTAVNTVAPKSSLSKTVEKIEGYVAANNTAKACTELKTFIKQVNTLAANKKKGISATQTASLIDLANEIKQTLGC